MNDQASVLVIDDDRSWRQMLCEKLENEFEVQQADNYGVALHMLTEANPPFHLLVADISLTGGGVDQQGMILLRKLREYNKLTSVIIVTGYPSIPTAKEAFTDLEVFDYLTKYPGHRQAFNPEHFLERARLAIKQAIERRKEVAIHAAPKILVFVSNSAIRESVMNALGGLTSAVLDVMVPEVESEKIERQVQSFSCDLVIIQVDPGDDPTRVRRLIATLRRSLPEAEILGVGHYEPSHRLIVDTLVHLGVSNLIDARTPLDIRRITQAIAISSTKKYFTACFKDIPASSPLELRKEYRFVVSIQDTLPPGIAGIALNLVPEIKRPIRFNVAISSSSNGISLYPSTVEDLVVFPTGDVKPAEFRVIGESPGRQAISLQFYRDGRWQRQLQVECNFQ